jgi:sulfatase modifying factor 1
MSKRWHNMICLFLLGESMIDWIAELRNLGDLKNQGVLSEEEFQLAKKRVLEERDFRASNDDAQGVEQFQTQAPTPRSTQSGISKEETQFTDYEQEGQIGSYKIFGVIGKGGMGEVFRARHMEESWAKRQGGDVALKIMRPRFAKDPTFRDRFIREGDVGKRVDHPNIARVHEVILDSGTLGLVMELIEGDQLDDLIPKDGMALDKAIEILEPLCDALDSLHEKNIVHRDLKPENIRLRKNKQPVILDFGIAKAGEKEDEGMTKTGVLMGTVTYMAPEQIDAKNVGPAADRYALGIIAYELLSSKRPWPKDLSEGRIYTRKLQGNINPLNYEKPELGEKISKAIMRMLSIRPEHRYPSCKAFINTLKNGGEEDFSPEDGGIDDHEARANVRRQYSNLKELNSELQLKVADTQDKSLSMQRERDGQLQLLEKQYIKDKKHHEEELDKIQKQVEHALGSLEEEFDRKRQDKHDYIKDLKKTISVATQELKAASQASSKEWNRFVSIFSSEKKKTLDTAVNRSKGKLSDAKKRVEDAQENLEKDLAKLDKKQVEARERFISAGESRKEKIQSSVRKKVNVLTVSYNQQRDQIILNYDHQHRELESLLKNYSIEQERANDKIDGLKEAYPKEWWIVKQVLEVGRERLEMVEIEVGSFLMGAFREDSMSQVVEKPRHEVILTKNMWMSVAPISQALYDLVIGSNPSKQKHPKNPVENVSWFDAIEFCNRLSVKHDLPPAYMLKNKKIVWVQDSIGYRLPSESEWEYAARADKDYLFSGSADPKEVAWFGGNSNYKPQKIGLRKPNDFGLHDMSGNVWEWCYDGSSSYPSNSVMDPIGDEGSDKRVRRGGSWRNKPSALRVTHRSNSDPSRVSNACGFRIVRNVI